MTIDRAFLTNAASISLAIRRFAAASLLDIGEDCTRTVPEEKHNVHYVHYLATVNSWVMKYWGPYAQDMARTIHDMKQESETSGGPASILPVVQSSGMGKSRLLHEVACLIVTIPLNIRCGSKDSDTDMGECAPTTCLTTFTADDNPQDTRWRTAEFMIIFLADLKA